MLKAENLSLYVDDEGEERCLLNDISFQVDDGEMLVITGPNGGGKSTLAKTLMGINHLNSGKIILDGEDITDFDINHRANAGIGYAFQQPPRFKGMTVLRLLKLASGENLSDEECCNLLKAVGLCAKDYINREVNASLSGGELKRIEIAMIIARGTKLSLFDEPEAGIDLWSFNNLIRVFESLHEKIKGSIIIISHQERILNIADKIIVLSGGEVTAVGTKDEVMPKLIESSEACSTLLDKLA